MLEFYTNPMSRGTIARWMLEEVGVAYEERILTYGSEMKAESYRAINPMGKVPALRHDGRVITEAAAICTYLADAFPEAGLAPALQDRADYYRWFFFASGPVEQAITARSLGWEPNNEEQAMAGFGHFDLVVDVIDKFLSGRTYVCGDHFTAADVYLGAQLMLGLEFKILPERESFSAYAARLGERDAIKKARARDHELIAAMTTAEGS